MHNFCQILDFVIEHKSRLMQLTIQEKMSCKRTFVGMCYNRAKSMNSSTICCLFLAKSTCFFVLHHHSFNAISAQKLEMVQLETINCHFLVTLKAFISCNF